MNAFKIPYNYDLSHQRAKSVIVTVILKNVTVLSGIDSTNEVCSMHTSLDSWREYSKQKANRT